MKCSYCLKDFEEKDIDDSHDVPTYLFYDLYKLGSQSKRNVAYTFGRHYLCKPCHEKYESSLNLHLKKEAVNFAHKFFGGKGDDTTTASN